MDNNSLITHITAQLHGCINSGMTTDKLLPSPFSSGQVKPWKSVMNATYANHANLKLNMPINTYEGRQTRRIQNHK